MNNNIEIYFGDKNTFAVRYISGFTESKSNHAFAHCHLILGGQIIGSKDEPCLLSTWLMFFEELKNQIKTNFDSIRHPEFANRSDDEVFELIWKSNQLEEDFNLNYIDLPILDNEVWRNCAIRLDETIDAFLVTMNELNGEIKFIWKGWRSPCPKDQLGKLYSIIVEREFVIETMEKCLKSIREDIINY